ncbi:hypothetical protein [Paenibacillus sp. SN-8-1]|uniref:hypothetical protein n=1 Tax=Paenibacillus sp. SN-8-1 TaxID=3435409 RepID=UPI003D9A8D21
MIKKHIIRSLPILLAIVSLIFIILNYQNGHRLNSLQMKIDDEVQSNLSTLEHNLSKVDAASFKSSLLLIREATSKLVAVASLSSYNNQQNGVTLSSVFMLLEQILRNADISGVSITQDQLMQLEDLIKLLSSDPGNQDLIFKLHNLIVTID